MCEARRPAGTHYKKSEEPRSPADLVGGSRASDDDVPPAQRRKKSCVDFSTQHPVTLGARARCLSKDALFLLFSRFIAFFFVRPPRTTCAAGPKKGKNTKKRGATGGRVSPRDRRRSLSSRGGKLSALSLSRSRGVYVCVCVCGGIGPCVGPPPRWMGGKKRAENDDDGKKKRGIDGKKERPCLVAGLGVRFYFWFLFRAARDLAP